eukprot:TRINITY_DN2805_c0_g1_i4.p1 TRINITY_DN2805_c0_g1~~TRINITY_DN2805_c0_g1_i4.p1  ORF type:complete len:949 (+),score=200.11 TRINITY_DN2805_c0_g1_i4:72-2849(+)
MPAKAPRKAGGRAKRGAADPSSPAKAEAEATPGAAPASTAEAPAAAEETAAAEPAAAAEETAAAEPAAAAEESAAVAQGAAGGGESGGAERGSGGEAEETADTAEPPADGAAPPADGAGPPADGAGPPAAAGGDAGRGEQPDGDSGAGGDDGEKGAASGDDGKKAAASEGDTTAGASGTAPPPAASAPESKKRGWFSFLPTFGKKGKKKSAEQSPSADASAPAAAGTAAEAAGAEAGDGAVADGPEAPAAEEQPAAPAGEQPAAPGRPQATSPHALAVSAAKAARRCTLRPCPMHHTLRPLFPKDPPYAPLWIRVVEAKTARGHREQRILAVTPTMVCLTDPEGNIKKYLRHSEITQAVAQKCAAGFFGVSSEEQVLLQSAHPPDVLLHFVPDRRNGLGATGASDFLQCLAQIRREVHGEELRTEMRTEKGKKNALAKEGRLAKPQGYAKPEAVLSFTSPDSLPQPPEGADADSDDADKQEDPPDAVHQEEEEDDPDAFHSRQRGADRASGELCGVDPTAGAGWGWEEHPEEVEICRAPPGVEDVVDWSEPMAGGWPSFVDLPDYKAFALGPPWQTPGMQRVWAASWGAESQEAADAEALQRCRQWAPSAKVVWPGDGSGWPREWGPTPREGGPLCVDITDRDGDRNRLSVERSASGAEMLCVMPKRHRIAAVQMQLCARSPVERLVWDPARRALVAVLAAGRDSPPPSPGSSSSGSKRRLARVRMPLREEGAELSELLQRVALLADRVGVPHSLELQPEAFSESFAASEFGTLQAQRTLSGLPLPAHADIVPPDYPAGAAYISPHRRPLAEREAELLSRVRVELPRRCAARGRPGARPGPCLSPPPPQPMQQRRDSSVERQPTAVSAAEWVTELGWRQALAMQEGDDAEAARLAAQRREVSGLSSVDRVSPMGDLPLRRSSFAC